MPNPAATEEPTIIPITGPHRRNKGAPRRARAATTTRVTRAVNGAFVGSSCDASSSRANTTEANVIDNIIITMPPTVGVTIRLSMNSHLEMTSWATAATNTSVVSVAGPPSVTAVMQKGMETAAVNMGRTAPAPMGPIPRTWTSVETPTTTSEAKTIHTR